MNKKTAKMKKSVYLGLAFLGISKRVVYEFCYDYIKPKYGGKEKLCYTDNDSLLVHAQQKFLGFSFSCLRLEDVFSVTIFHIPRHLQDVFLFCCS